MPDAELTLWTEVWSAEESSALFLQLRSELDWQQRPIRMFGREVMQPRLTCWYGDWGADYVYSGALNTAQPWATALLPIREKMAAITGLSFNSMLGNWYRDGRDSVGWHSDDEPELGQQPAIASISLGAERRFRLQHKKRKELQFHLDLPDASLLLMAGPMQRCWRHALPKQTGITEPRINLTFRYVTPRAVTANS